jgi:hypothetical protein
VSNLRDEDVRYDEDRVEVGLAPPEAGFKLYRYKNVADLRTKGWHGYYWAKPNEAGDYEIQSVPASVGEPSVPGGVFPKEGFEEHYEKVDR